MTGIEDIIGRFTTLGKTTDPFILSQGMESIATTGDQFLGIGLVSNIPDYLIPVRIKNPIKSTTPNEGAI